MKLCKRCSLEEVAQAGGGNISVKDGDRMYIKASGVAISDVSISHGYSIVNTQKVLDSLQGTSEPNIMDFVLNGGPRPSLETYFHAFLRKYVVHLHPTSMSKFLCSNDSSLIEYEKPGFFLSKRIFQIYKSQPIFYLQNHGVILHSDSYDEVLQLVEGIHANHLKKWSTNIREFWKIQDAYENDFIYPVPYEDSVRWFPLVRSPILSFTPDIVLFLTDSLTTSSGGRIYIRASTKQKCLSILEVLRSYCRETHAGMTQLTEKHILEILNWEAEKYRKSIP